MTRKDFNLLAQMFAELEFWNGVALNDSDQLIVNDRLSDSNPNFNPQRFWNKVEAERIKLEQSEEVKEDILSAEWQ